MLVRPRSYNMNRHESPQRFNPAATWSEKEQTLLAGIVAAVVLLLIWTVCAPLPAGAAEEVPVVKGELGSCTADFTVTDSANKPLYDAKIHVTILYGFMNKRKSDLEVGTNNDGKARFAGLPNKVKKPLEYQIRSGQLTKTVVSDPGIDCHATITVALGAQ
jgi:hypothetical protein